MSEAPLPTPGKGPAFLEALRQFRHAIGDSREIPSPSGRLPRLTVRSRYRRKVVTALYLLTLVTAGVYFAPPLTGPDSVPAELVGGWTTDDTRYAGRLLELTPEALILRANAKEVTEYAVRRVQRSQTAQGSAYVITTYSERAGDYILMLDYHEAQKTFALGKPARGLWRRTR
jgi:hypothetical protein